MPDATLGQAFEQSTSQIIIPLTENYMQREFYRDPAETKEQYSVSQLFSYTVWDVTFQTLSGRK